MEAASERQSQEPAQVRVRHGLSLGAAEDKALPICTCLQKERKGN